MNTGDSNWKKLEEYADEDLSALINSSETVRLRSLSPLNKIKRSLLTGIVLGSLICSIYVIMIICFDYWQVRLAMALMLLSGSWALLTTFSQYLKIDGTDLLDRPVLAELKQQEASITGWMRSQTRMALLIYPVGAAGGFMLGGAMGSGKSISIFMSKPVIWLLFVILVAVLVPLCHQLAKWMSERSLGGHMKALRKLIVELESEI